MRPGEGGTRRFEDGDPGGVTRPGWTTGAYDGPSRTSSIDSRLGADAALSCDDVLVMLRFGARADAAAVTSVGVVVRMMGGTDDTGVSDRREDDSDMLLSD